MRAAARAIRLDASLPREPSGPCGRPCSCAVRARRAVHSAALDMTSTLAISCRSTGSLTFPVARARSMIRSTRPARQNRLPEAQSEFETAVSLDPTNARAHLHLGETRLFLGEPEAGIAPLEQAIRLSPDGPNLAIAYWALGTCQLLLGRVDQAIDLLQTASAANPRLWVPYLYLAGAYGLRGDLDKAKSALSESIRLKPAIKSLAR